MIEEILKFDTELFVYLNSLGSTNFDFFWLSLSRPEANIILYLLILMLHISIEPNKKSFVINLLLSIIILVTISDQFSNISKDFFQRLRPCFNESLIDSIRLVKDSCGGKYGFFSAHASNSFSLAIFFGLLLFKKNKLLILLFALYAFFISYSRIYLGVHYPIDILIGVFVGIVNGTFIYGAYLNTLNLFNK